MKLPIENSFIARLDPQSRITIEKHFRNCFGLKPGDYVKCYVVEKIEKKD